MNNVNSDDQIVHSLKGISKAFGSYAEATQKIGGIPVEMTILTMPIVARVVTLSYSIRREHKANCLSSVCILTRSLMEQVLTYYHLINEVGKDVDILNHIHDAKFGGRPIHKNNKGGWCIKRYVDIVKDCEKLNTGSSKMLDIYNELSDYSHFSSKAYSRLVQKSIESLNEGQDGSYITNIRLTSEDGKLDPMLLKNCISIAVSMNVFLQETIEQQTNLILSSKTKKKFIK